MHSQALRYAFTLLTLSLPTFAKISRTPPPLPANVTFPKHFGLIVWPAWAPADANGPTSVLGGLAYNYPELGIHLSVLSATLDPVSSRLLNGFNRIHNATAPFSDFGQSIMPTDTLDAVLARGGKTWVDTYPPLEGEENGGPNVRKTLSQIEFLIIPGGGTVGQDRSVEVGFLKQVYPKLKNVLSVCTGSTMLAQAGILDGRNATSNKFALPWIKTTWPEVQWVNRARWVQDGNVWTSAGVAAGGDATYAWVESVLGREVTEFLVARAEQVRWTDRENDPFADIWG